MASGITRLRRRSGLVQTPGSLFGEYLDMTRPYDGIARELDVGEVFRETLRSSIPALLFSGTLDGRTVLEEHRDATVGLSRVTRITVKNAGHNLCDSPPAELWTVVDQFMTNRPVARTTVVAAEPRFLPDARGP